MSSRSPLVGRIVRPMRPTQPNQPANQRHPAHYGETMEAKRLLELASSGAHPLVVMMRAAKDAPALDEFVADRRMPGAARAWVEWVLRIIDNEYLPKGTIMWQTAASVLHARGDEL